MDLCVCNTANNLSFIQSANKNRMYIFVGSDQTQIGARGKKGEIEIDGEQKRRKEK